VSLHLAQDNVTVSRAELWCMSCEKRKRILHERYHKQLMLVSKLSAQLNRWSTVPAIALMSHISTAQTISQDVIHTCQHLYKKRLLTQSELIGCFPSHILVENVAAKLNYTVHYFPALGQGIKYVVGNDVGLPYHYPVIAVVGILPWNTYTEYISQEILITQVLRGESISVFLYCTQTEIREGFSFLFWTVPFDGWSWILIGISTLVVTIVVRGQWFPIFDILLRQDCTILKGRQKWLMIFILATIIFTYGYEGVISSLLTVQPPVFVYNTLKDLVDNGYEVEAPTSTNGNLSPFNSIFEKENITGNPIRPAHWRPSIWDSHLSLYTCDVALAVQVRKYMLWLSELNHPDQKISCNYVRESRYSSPQVYQYLGEFYQDFVAVEDMLIQSGIWTHYLDYELYLQDSPVMRTLELREFNSTLPITFKMEDWKILSSFVVWAVVLLGTFLIFVSEYTMSKRRYIRFCLEAQLFRLQRMLKFTQFCQ